MELKTNTAEWETVEVYDYYDRPMIYTTKQKEDDTLYLHYFVDDDKEDDVNFSTFMVFPISEETLSRMVDADLSLRNMLLSAENMHLFHYYFEQDEIRMEKVIPSELPHDYIPEEDVFLD